VWQALPEKRTGLKEELWREMDALHFTGTAVNITFPDGECPEPYSHDGDNRTITLKNLGAYKSLTISDIMHSMAVISGGSGIESLLGGIPWGDGVPGGSDTGTFLRERIASLKAKEIRLAMTLVLNGWDELLINGDVVNYPNEFNGMVWLVTGSCANTNDTSASGSFSATAYDRFLAESCAKPTHLFGHPQAIQELLSMYFQLGFQGSQVVNFADGDRITPGFNFAGFVNTGVGRLAVVADSNFPRVNIGDGTFWSDIFSLRMTHNGEPLVYKVTQIPLALKDLVPGCTAIAFEVWAKTALIIKHQCAHGRYTGRFTGRIVTTCPIIGEVP